MPVNIEIKAKIKDFAKIQQVAQQLSGEPGCIIKQEDVFYNVPSGRLKLRILKEQPSQLVFYERHNSTGPKRSDYEVTSVLNPNEMNRILERSLGMKGTVKKERLLFLVGQTRIHLDSVKGLGHFIELEVVLRDDQTDEDGTKIADELASKLGIESLDLIDVAYIDLLSNLSSAAAI